MAFRTRILETQTPAALARAHEATALSKGANELASARVGVRVGASLYTFVHLGPQRRFEHAQHEEDSISLYVLKEVRGPMVLAGVVGLD